MPGDIILLYIHVYHNWRSYDIWFLKYKVQQIESFIILDHFFSFQPLDNLENQNFNTEKNTWRCYHFTHLHYKWQSYDVWFLRYGTQQTEFFVILDHFLLFCLYGPRRSKFWKNEQHTWRYYHFTNAYHKWQSYDVWFLRYEVQQTEFFVILDCFLPFYPTMDPENQNFEKMKKTLEDIIILQMFTINDSHMIYGFSDTECNRQNFFLSFWTIFCPFTPLTTQKIKILKKWKNHLEILSLYTCVP